MPSKTIKLPLGGPAWLRAQADEKEEMRDLLPSEMFKHEDKREIQGLRDAANRIEALEVAMERIKTKAHARPLEVLCEIHDLADKALKL